MKGKKLLILLGSVCLILVLAALPFMAACPAPENGVEPPPENGAEPPPEEEVFKWDMTYPLYRGTWDWEILEKWCDDLRVASDGRLDITPYSGGEIMPVMETFDAVSTGTLKIDFTYGPYWLGKTPMSIFSSGLPPMTLPLREHYTVLYYERGFEELLREAYAEHNIFYVGTILTNNAVILSKFPISTVADFAGKVFRAPGIYGELVAKAGGAATYFPWGEIMGALEKGTCDAVVAGPLSCQCDSGFHEVTSYFLETPLTPLDCWCLHINMDAWNALPDDLQMLFIESCSYAGDLFTASYYVHDAMWREKIVDEWGFTVTHLPEEEQAILRQYSLEILDKYSAEDPYFAEATEILKDYMRELGLLE